MKMKKNNLIITRSQRASTEGEIEYLQHLLLQSISPRKRLLKAILNTLVMWGGALLLLLFVSSTINYLVSNNEMLTKLVSFPGIQSVFLAGSAFYALFSTYRWLTTTENSYPFILQDIIEGQVFDETYYVQEVCRFQEPKLGGFIYFLKISEQNIFVTYDYLSQTESDNIFLIKQKLILSHAPHCNHFVNLQFTGEPIAINATFPLTLPPDKWPLPDSWLCLPWSDLKSYLN
jgi:hypothetical protein